MNSAQLMKGHQKAVDFPFPSQIMVTSQEN